MKIAYIPSWYPVEVNSLEGIFIKEQVQLLAPSLEQCTVLYQVNSKRTLSRQLIRYYEEGMSSYFMKAPYLPKLNKPIFIQWCKNYRWLLEKYCKEKQKPEILHGHGYMGGLVCAQLSKSTGIPYCITLHDTSIANKQIKSWRFQLFMESMNHASAVLSVSNFLKEAVYGLGVKRPIQVIQNPVHPRFIQYDNELKKESEFRFCIIGSLDKRKRVELAVDGFDYMIRKYNKQAKLWIIGDGEQRKLIEERIDEYGIQDKVELFGWVYREDLPDFISGIDCIISVSALETFGISLIEGMAMGKPLLVTDSGGVRDILTSTNGMMIEDASAANIGEAMLSMIENNNQFNSQDIKVEAQKKFGHEHVNNRILEIYKSIV